MNKIFFTSLFLALSASVAFSAEPPLASGYYRVKNYKTERYIYVYDNTGSVDAAAGAADAGALALWKNHDRTISDPGSVLYANYKGSNGKGGFSYDVEAQGTSVYGIIGYYVSIYRIPSKQLNIYASMGSMTRYLDDDETYLPLESGQMGFNATGDFRKWVEEPIDANSDNYFGIAPTLKGSGKYYQPFFASFPFNFASSGMKAYYIKQLDATLGVAVIDEVQGDVPGSMPVIVECSSDQPSSNRLNLLHNSQAPLRDNQLKGVYFNNERRPRSKDARTAYNAATMRVLAVDAAGKLVYKLSSEKYLAANQSYLVVPEGTASEVLVMTEAEYKVYADAHQPESIGQVAEPSRHTIYSLTGKKLPVSDVDALAPGIYVVDGKKIVIY